MITYIKTENLLPHPNNPRQDLGDLTELAQSIKEQGVLQNLTVVPLPSGVCMSCRIYNGPAGKCKEGHDEHNRPPCPEWKSSERYTVIIGHRRLAAAKLSGLAEVPCAVVEMDKRSQIATMLLENIQRSDLTVYEQAQGFQMMFDLGETAVSIAKKTGFSETTIRRRVKLLDLDKDEFKKAAARGATLMDFAALEEIEDPNERNDVLKSIGTDNFKWRLKNAIDKEKRMRYEMEAIKILDTFAVKIEQVDYKIMQYVRGYSIGEAIEKPAAAGEKKYYYTLNYGPTLYRERDQEDASAAAESARELAEREARINALREKTKLAYTLRREFITGFTQAKKHTSDILEVITQTLVKYYTRATSDEVAEMLGLKNQTGEWDKADLEQAILDNPEHAALVAVYSALENNGGYYDYRGEYQPNENTDNVYAFLLRLGYQMSDEEKALKDGTHELFKKPD
jgi:ParB family chromosome partitioning protein